MPSGNSLAGRGLEHKFAFESYGVRVRIEASDVNLLLEAERQARKALVENVRKLDPSDAKYSFGIAAGDQGTLHLFQNGKQISSDDNSGRFFKFFDSVLRIAVAEHAVGWVFIHAGVVAVNGRAIVIPGDSFSGKTTLVRELVHLGAEYYSDEYAVLDRSGFVHPFPRDLSIRYLEGGSVAERDLSVGSIGGTTGSDPVPVGMVVLTRFEKGAKWDPDRLSVGQGILEAIPHTIPRLTETAYALKVLNTALSDAIILKSSRGDAEILAPELLSFF